MDNHGCDMRGMFSFQILFLLSKKPMHGEGIAQEIKERRGEKPKAGTLYPALKDMSSRGLITREKKGKIITYSITTRGREALRHAMKYFVRSFGDILAKN
jgi:PadR family transcriptional regulator, regulatory protein PadR